MKITPNLKAVLAIFLVINFACQKENRNATPGKNPEQVTMVTSSFQGRVTDESGSPLGGVTISSGTKVAHTDVNGVFRLTDVTVPDVRAVVAAETPGYFPGSRTVITNNNGNNFIEIRLIKRDLSGVVEGSIAKKIEVSNGVSVSFPGNSFVKTNGTVYTGKVNVFAAYLDPEADEFVHIMPGDLRGINSENKYTGLLSFGMLAVELESETGERLQLAEGNKVTISAAIPNSLTNAAPASIPLWYFDESKGIWIEEGSATRLGNKYTGEVAHFSYWNYDRPSDFVYTTLRLVNQNNGPVPYTLVKITDTRNFTYGTGTTDSTGFVKMWVPKDAPLQLTVINQCNEIIHTASIGPYSNDIDLGNVNLVLPTSGVIEITGNVVNCGDQPVTNGFVNILLQGLNYSAPVENGNYKIMIGRCNISPADAEITAVDLDSLKQSSSQHLTVTSGIYNAELIHTCDIDVKDFISINLAGEVHEWHVPPDSLIFNMTGATTYIAIIQNATGQGIGLTLADTIPHQGHTAMNIYIYENARRYYGDSVSYNVIKYGRKDEYIELDFNGQVRTDSAQTGDFRPVSGNLLIKRRR